jgi:hypothetical protein
MKDEEIWLGDEPDHGKSYSSFIALPEKGQFVRRLRI